MGLVLVLSDLTIFSVKYVALLAFNKIVLTHPYLVAEQEDVIMDCLDSPDISIRLRALDLVVGMVSTDNLTSIVGRLMRQLRNSTPDTAPNDRYYDQASILAVEPVADSDDERPEMNIKSTKKSAEPIPPLPEEYKIDVIQRILEMCSANNYANLVDFEWYIDILIQLVRISPFTKPSLVIQIESASLDDGCFVDIAERVGEELRNIAVKVKALRATVTRAAESILIASYDGSQSQGGIGKGALRPVALIAGEYPNYLSSPEDTLTALLYITRTSSSPGFLAVYLQAIPKIFSFLAGNEQYGWTPERKTMISLLMARIIHTIEPLATHPDLEVQERAVEFCELLRLAAEASTWQDASSGPEQRETPLLLTQAIPSLFAGLELNSVAPGAQYNVPLPTALNLDKPINQRLNELLREADLALLEEAASDEFEIYYHQRPVPSILQPVANRLLGSTEITMLSYQHGSDDSYLDPDILARRRAERRERNKDDPFYIAGSDPASGTSTSLENIIRSDDDYDNNGLDIDSIPVMQLDLGQTTPRVSGNIHPRKGAASRTRQLIQVAADENLSTSGTSTPKNEDSDPGMESSARNRSGKFKNHLLLVDTSGVGAFALERDNSGADGPNHKREQLDDAEMAKAMQEVEKLRLEMQRANERIQAAQGVPPEGTLVKKKAKKKVKSASGENEDPKPRKKKVKKTEEMGSGSPVGSSAKNKNVRKKTNIEEAHRVNEIGIEE